MTASIWDAPGTARRLSARPVALQDVAKGRSTMDFLKRIFNGPIPYLVLAGIGSGSG